MIRHEEFIEAIAVIKRPKSYLELGLYQGDTINRISKYFKNKENIVGVDMLLEPIIDGTFHKMSTDDFFKQNKKNFDMIFIDADHRYESVKKDFKNSIKILNPGGVILLHDTDPENDNLFNDGYCGDCYKIVKELEEDERYNITTLPIEEAGLSIVTRKNETRTQIRK
jgi:predicted O-methyltransferase YrrM